MKEHKKMRNFISGLIFIGLLAGLTGCTSQKNSNDPRQTLDKPVNDLATKNNTPDRPRADDSAASTQGMERVIEANNKFALSMFKDINEHPEQGSQNVFFSPYSISTAVAMLYTATDGETKQQIQSTFYYPALDVLKPNTAALYNKFNQNNEHYKLTTVNDLWLEQSFNAKQSYVDTVKQYYGGQVTNLDFKTEANASRIRINKSIAGYTNQMIQNLLPDNSISSDTEAVLTNAIYFKGDWGQPFESENTQVAPFYSFNNMTLDANMMHQMTHFAYAEDGLAQVIQLPYKGDDLSMTIVLPKAKDKDSMDKLINGLNMTMINTWEDSMGFEKVVLDMPKFKLNEGYKLKDRLSSMGMPRVFQNNAGIDIFDDRPPLKVDTILHKAVVEVDETGTEAAAATAIIMETTSMAPESEPPKVFRADHPFLFMIKDNRTDTILFMGQLNQP